MNPIIIPNPMMAEESLLRLQLRLQHLNSINEPGDVVEAGCNNGLTSIFLASIMQGSSRWLHCYDAFAELPVSVATLPTEAGNSHVPLPTQKAFHDLFNQHPEVKTDRMEVHIGLFSDTMPGQLPDQIALALVDCDYYLSIKQALSSILPRLTPHGSVFVHDWGQEKWGVGVAKAIEEFKQYQLVLLECGLVELVRHQRL